MIVVSPVDEDAADPKEALEPLEAADALHALRHDESVRNLVASSVAAPIRPVWLTDESDGEAPFSVYKTDDPTTELDQSFLLIFRTRHVVTVGIASDDYE
jgi:hypothetical protein